MFGTDDPPLPRPSSDQHWIVRRAERNPWRADCPPLPTAGAAAAGAAAAALSRIAQHDERAAAARAASLADPPAAAFSSGGTRWLMPLLVVGGLALVAWGATSARAAQLCGRTDGTADGKHALANAPAGGDDLDYVTIE
jgi:hypothetical protein